MGVPQVTFRDTRVRDGDLARSVCADVWGLDLIFCYERPFSMRWVG